jgi:hypothetical protein
MLHDNGITVGALTFILFDEHNGVLIRTPRGEYQLSKEELDSLLNYLQEESTQPMRTLREVVEARKLNHVKPRI